MATDFEKAACDPQPIDPAGFNRKARLPYGLKVEQVHRAMGEYIEFLGFVNPLLNSKGIVRLETMLMPANFSSVVGEFMASSLPKHCKGLVKNKYHNGHPDMLLADVHPGDSIRYAEEGIEIKASRYLKGWQGHNPENCWLMVFVFDSNRPADLDPDKGVQPRPFRFVMVAGAKLTKDDWLFSGRSDTSRRTITAGVTRSGYEKMMANWIYRDPAAAKA